MHASATEKSSSYELAWSLDITAPAVGQGDPTLDLEYKVKALEELYVSDRLWTDSADRYRFPDPFGVYRFVRDGSLRLVFAQAPAPPNIRVADPYRPLYSRILAGETRTQTVRIKLPVLEYSILARNVHAEAALEEVSRVFFVLGYWPRSAMDRAPAPPMHETAEEAGYVVYGQRLMISSAYTDRIPVERRTVYMARFSLPGEPPPEPKPIPRSGS
jgi:hypothetical protein